MPRTPRTSSRLVLSALLLTLLPALPAAAWPGGPAAASPAAPEIVFSTYLGGELWDQAEDLAVDADGRAWVTGTTASRHFPAAGEPPEPVFYIAEPTDGFLVRLGPEGHLLASSYVGSEFNDDLRAVALDPAGRPWEVGTTDGQPDSAVLLAEGTSAGYYQLFSSFDRGLDVGLDAAGDVYVLGGTEDAHFGFDLFVQKRSPAGEEIWVGGSGQDNPQALAVAPDGTSYVVAGGGRIVKFDPAGQAVPFDPQLPVLASVRDIAADPAGNLHVLTGEGDQLLYVELSPAGQALAALHFGGSGGDSGSRLALGPNGDVAILGLTDSADLPLVRPVDADCPADPGRPGMCRTTAFVLRLVGTQVAFASYLPFDASRSQASAIGLGPRSDLYLAGSTSDPDFPTLGAVQAELDGASDAWAMRITTNLPPTCAAAAPQPASIWPDIHRLTRIAIQGVVDPEGGPVALTVTAIRQDEPLVRTYRPDGAGVGTAVPRVRSARDSRKDGRVYTIAFLAQDAHGDVCAGSVTVCVPLFDGGSCVDGGPLFDSTAFTPALGGG